MSQSASISLIDATTAGSRQRRPLPLSELAIANRQRDALYLLSDQLHRADSFRRNLRRGHGCDRVGARLRSLRHPAVRRRRHHAVRRFARPVRRLSRGRHRPLALASGRDGRAADRHSPMSRASELDENLKATVAGRGHPRRRVHSAGFRRRADRQIHGVLSRALQFHER